MPKARILVMDDEELVRKVAGKMLEFIGYEPTLCGDGAEALALYEQARAAGAPFDLVILDLQVPGGMGGTAALAELLRIDPQAKAVISSGYGDQPPSGPAPTGHVAVIAKPYELKKLEREVADALAGQPHNT